MKTNIDQELLLARLQDEAKALRGDKRALLGRLRKMERELNASLAIDGVHTTRINPIRSRFSSEATAVILASDWHLEEEVKLGSVSGLNEHTLEISKERSVKFFQSTARLIKIFGKDIPIRHAVLWLGGDFITSSIHEENVETALLLPIDAVIEAQNRIASGIQFLLDNTDCDWVIPCSCGNHTRITEKQRHATEQGNNLETFMYYALANHFKGSKRVRFILPQGYHTYLPVYSYTLRFHHGHSIKYGGGIGGLFIPTFKAISQWNKGRTADWDFFGHWHQVKDGGNFVTNGSLIGYSSYALSIKADFEKPRQVFCLIDKNRGRTVTTPIVV